MKRLNLVLMGLTALSLPVSAFITADFNVDLSPDAQNFASNSATSLTLNYTIDGFGNVALDAVAPGGGAARWDQIDNASAGTTAATALFNTSLTLTYSGTDAPILFSPTNYGNAGTGAVLVAKNNGLLTTGEFVAFTVSGTATAVSGFSLDLTNFSYDYRIANGSSSFGVEDTSGTVIEQLISNSSPNGTIDGTGISLAAGEVMTFRTINGNAGGAGLSGFAFTVTAVPEPSTVALYFGIVTLGLVMYRRRRR